MLNDAEIAAAAATVFSVGEARRRHAVTVLRRQRLVEVVEIVGVAVLRRPAVGVVPRHPAEHHV